MSKAFEAECDQQLNWMQSLLSGKGAPATTSSSKNKYESQIDDLLASIEGPPAPVAQPKISDVCQEFDELNDESRLSIEPSLLTGAVPAREEVKQYRISDPVDSEDDSDCEEYYVEDAEQIRGQEIPDWARAKNLIVELEKQQRVDPDKIFVGFDSSCDLSSMFEKKKKTFKVRGDSGWWAADAVTPEEESNYKKALGFA